MIEQQQQRCTSSRIDSISDFYYAYNESWRLAGSIYILLHKQVPYYNKFRIHHLSTPLSHSPISSGRGQLCRLKGTFCFPPSAHIRLPSCAVSVMSRFTLTTAGC